MGVCLDMTAAGTPSPAAVENDTAKEESTQKQVKIAPEKNSKRCPPEQNG